MTEAEELELLELENQNALAKSKAGGSKPPPSESQPKIKTLAEKAVSLVQPPKVRPRPKNAAEGVIRFTKDMLEGMSPPTSIEGLKRIFTPSPGSYGPLRSAEDVAKYGSEDVDKMGEKFMETKFAQENPNLAATIATGGTMAAQLSMMAPSDIPGMVALQGINPSTGKAPAIIRGVIPNAIEAEMAARRGIGKAASWATKKGITTVFGPKPEAVEARFARPDAIKKASLKPYDAQAEELAKAANTIETELGKMDKEAWKNLSTSHNPDEGAIPRAAVEDIIKKAKADLQITGGGALGAAQKKAVAELSQMLDDLPGIGARVGGKIRSEQGVESALKNKDFFSQSQVKEMIQAIRKNVKFGDPDAGVINDALQSVSEPLDDMLKVGNPAYAKAMQPVQDRTRLLKDLRNTFNLKSMTNEGLVATDTTASKLKTSQGQNRSVTRGVLRRVKGATGTDFNQAAKDFALSQEFVGGSPNGARRVAAMMGLGGGLGGFFGGPIGTGIGAGAGGLGGLMIDTNGREIAGGLIDMLARLTPSSGGPSGSLNDVLRAASILAAQEELRQKNGR